MFSSFSKGTGSMKMWAGLFPIYFKAFIKALLYKKPIYKVTPKGLKPRKNIVLVIPQLSFLISALGAAFFHFFHYGLTWVLAINAYWVCVMMYFMSMVIFKAFPKKTL